MKIFRKIRPASPMSANPPYFRYSFWIQGQFDQKRWQYPPIHEKSEKFVFFENFKKICENACKKLFFYVTGPNQWN